MIRRLLLIFYLLSLGSPVLAQKIDLSLCKHNAACFIRESCEVDETDDTKLTRYTSGPLKNGDCDVIMQGRAFSDSEFHIIVQVKSSDGPISNEGVSLVQGPNNEMHFQCTKRGVTSNGGLITRPYKGLRSGNHITFNETTLSCSFLLYSASPAKPIHQLFENYDGMYPLLIFHTSVKNEIKFESDGDTLWGLVTYNRACDAKVIETKDDNNGSHNFDMVDSTQSRISCADFGLLQIKRKDGRVHHPKALICYPYYGSGWTYEIWNGTRTETHQINSRSNEKLDVSCVTRTCLLCPPLEYFDCGHGCEKFASYGQGFYVDCVTSICYKNLWRVDHENPRNGTIECRQREGSTKARDSVWYFDPSDPSSRREEVTKAACAVNADCRNGEVSGVKWECPQVDYGIGCAYVLYSENKDVTCPNNTQLKIQNGKGQPFESSYLTCDVITGRYVDSKKMEIDYNSSVYCKKLPYEPPPVPALEWPGWQIVAWVGIGILALLMILLFTACFVLEFRKYRNRRMMEELRRTKARLDGISSISKTTHREE